MKTAAREATGALDWVASPTGQYVLLALITLLAAGLRLYRLGEWSFWIDELYSVRRGLLQTEVSEIVARWPPITTLLIGATLRQLGVSEWSARIVPAAIGVLSVPILYFPFRRLVGVTTALMAALLLAMSPWHLFWSQNSRFYTALMLLYALAALAFFFALEKNRPSLILVGYALLLLAFRERYLALMLVPVVITYVLLLLMLRFELPAGLNRRTIGFLLIGGVALLLYDLYSLVWLGYSQMLAVTILEYVEPVGNPLRLAITIAFAVGLPVTVLGTFAGVQSVAQGSRPGLFLLVGASVPLAVLLAANPFVFTDERYAFVTLPNWVVLAALAVTQLWRAARSHQLLLPAAVLAVVVADATATQLWYYRVNNGNRLDWRGAFSLVRERSRDTDVVVGWWPEFGPYYAGREMVAWRDLRPQTVMASGQRYWFVLDSETVWGNTRMKQWVEANADLIEVRYLRTLADESLRVYLYDPAAVPHSR